MNETETAAARALVTDFMLSFLLARDAHRSQTALDLIHDAFVTELAAGAEYVTGRQDYSVSVEQHVDSLFGLAQILLSTMPAAPPESDPDPG